MKQRMVIPAQVGLFGGVEPPRSHAPKFITEKANGYAARPGTGPEGESCGTCSHCRVRQVIAGMSGLRDIGTRTPHKKRFYKCGRMLAAWNTSRTTDVLVHSPACELWEAGKPTETHLSPQYHSED